MSVRNAIPTFPDDDRLLHFILITSQQEKWDALIAFLCQVLFYVGILSLLIVIVTLISKLLWTLNEQSGSGRAPAATESSTLLPKYEEVPFSYGTCGGEGDLESGNSSSGDAYDGKVCVVCYDHRRNCFFVPCGHSATCSICAIRIVEIESKTCPVCRRSIRKVRKLLGS